LQKYPEYDLTQVLPHQVEGKIAIVGGAGLLHPPFKRQLDMIAGEAEQVYLWGVGLNTHDERHDYEPLSWPIVQRSEMFGTRDHIATHHRTWHKDATTIGCPSVCHPFLENPSEPIHDVVAYVHKDYHFPIENGIPAITNSCEIDEALHFIAKGKTVISSSYHGALWASWMGREVIIPNPFSTKFYIGLKDDTVHYGNHTPTQLPNEKGRESYHSLLETHRVWASKIEAQIGGA
tara:strand:+ start:1049 stop:1750 length:702 start_codon:yes stop_codon:yes gene_type:complete